MSTFLMFKLSWLLFAVIFADSPSGTTARTNLNYTHSGTIIAYVKYSVQQFLRSRFLNVEINFMCLNCLISGAHFFLDVYFRIYDIQ